MAAQVFGHRLVLLLNAVVRYRDCQTAIHSRRVAENAVKLAEAMTTPHEEVIRIGRAALLHDIGKVAIPDDILLKPCRLSWPEERVMRTHAEVGEQLLLLHDDLAGLAPLVRHHHERFDGTGYPDGLAGDDIPRGARIIAVVDAFDAMTSNRPYREALSATAAHEELVRCAGSQFDPEILASFESIIGQRRPLHVQEYSYR